MEHALFVDGLEYNLLSISHEIVIFEFLYCQIICIVDNKIIFIGKRLENTYVIDTNKITKNVKCIKDLDIPT